MSNNIDVKDILLRVFNKIVFPDFSNRISWVLLSSGVLIIAGTSTFTLVFVNWMIENFNLNNGIGFTLSEYKNAGPGYGWGMLCIVLALIHNISYRTLLVWQEKIKNEKDTIDKQGGNALKMESDRREYTDNQSKIDVDKSLFEKFRTEFGSDSNSILLLKNHNFGSSYYYSDTDEIENFVEKWDKSDNKFLDVELESKKSELWIACKEFWWLLATNSHSGRDGTRKCVIPEIYRDRELPNDIMMKYLDINNKATSIYDLHQEFVLLCRQKLKC